MKTKYELNRFLYNIGEHSYISGNTVIGNPKETQIGKYCSIARGCCIGTSQHPTNTLSTHCFIYSEYEVDLYGELRTPKENIIDISKTIYPPIKIGNDVWIGLNAIIMDGLTIGDGSVIGAGAVVTHDVPPYAIMGGVPAKIIKYRFEKDIVNQLLELKWWDYPKDFITRLPFLDLKKCIDILRENKHLKEKQ